MENFEKKQERHGLHVRDTSLTFFAFELVVEENFQSRKNESRVEHSRDDLVLVLRSAFEHRMDENEDPVARARDEQVFAENTEIDVVDVLVEQILRDFAVASGRCETPRVTSPCCREEAADIVGRVRARRREGIDFDDNFHESVKNILVKGKRLFGESQKVLEEITKMMMKIFGGDWKILNF